MKEYFLWWKYIIPKPLDDGCCPLWRLPWPKLRWKAVWQKPITDWEAYNVELNKTPGLDNQLSRVMIGNKGQAWSQTRGICGCRKPEDSRCVAQMAQDEGVVLSPSCWGMNRIHKIAAENGIDLEGMPIINPKVMIRKNSAKNLGTILSKTPAPSTGMKRINDEGPQLFWLYAGAGTCEADCLISGFKP